jgi:menaquinone-dependent protoporphyrinogen oxidase
MEANMKRRQFIMTGLAGSAFLLMKKKAMGLSFFANPSDLKCAVLYGSLYGSTRDAAVWISEGMGGIAEVFDVRENPDLSKFDSLIIGSGIYGGKAAPALIEFAAAHKQELEQKTKGYFVVCGASSPQADNYLNVLKALCKVNTDCRKVLGGRMTIKLLSKTHYDSLKKYFESGNRKFEDYDRLLRSDCLNWGESVLSVISKPKEKAKSI